MANTRESMHLDLNSTTTTVSVTPTGGLPHSTVIALQQSALDEVNPQSRADQEQVAFQAIYDEFPAYAHGSSQSILDPLVTLAGLRARAADQFTRDSSIASSLAATDEETCGDHISTVSSSTESETFIDERSKRAQKAAAKKKLDA